MSIGMGMAMELQQEAQATRKYLASLPEDAMDFKPHEKSMTMGALAAHLVEMVDWCKPTVEEDVFDMDPSTYETPKFESKAALIEAFDKSVGEAIEALSGCPDEKMMVTWTMKVLGEDKFSMPRMACLRGFILNHLYHHRGQLGVYLRMKDVPLEQVYGPTADFPQM